MLHDILHCALHALKDGALSVPILFIAYLFMELLERSRKLDERVLHTYSRKAGPALGGILGAIPQCGISGAAATLFSTGSVTVGTMLAVFFATSDEMLPVMLSSLADKNGPGAAQIFSILAAKALLGIALGYLVDALFGKAFAAGRDIHSFCEREGCECDDEGSVWLSALHHTVKITLMLVAVTFAINLVMHFMGIERLANTVFSKPIIGEALLALIGLVPNCSVSVIITEAYISGLIGLGGLFAGLLSNAGIGLLVLFRSNRNLKENLAVLALLYALGAVTGMIVGVLF